MTENRDQRPIMGKSDDSGRIGQIGNAKSVWDNGLYAKGVIEGVAVEFIVDSGSTATLLSKESFVNMGGEHTIGLHQKNIVMQGVDGKNLNVYGYANINISFDGNHVLHSVIVCDITPEGILGQDFLLKHIKTWDLDVPCLRTRQNTVIPLATGGETQTVCSVLIKDKTQIPPRSVCFVPVDIVNCQNLAANGYVEGICSETSPDQMTVVPGIVNPHQEETDIAIMNESDVSITLNPGAAVATCRSSYEAIEKHHDIKILEFDTAAEEHKVSATTRNQILQTEKQTLTNNQCLLEGWNAIAVAQEQLDDPKIGTLYVAKRDDKPRPEWNQDSSGSSALKTLWRQWDRLEMHAGMLFRKWTDGDQLDSTFQLIVPDSKKLQVLSLSHDIPSAGHLGVDKTLDKVRQSFYWPAMSDDVRRNIKSCDSCTARKLSRNKKQSSFGSVPGR